MGKTKATRGNSAQFTYDFGIAIAQSTVDKVTRLTGATLTLASAFYALKTTAREYVDILRENTLRFGGVLSTMKSIEQAQNRLIKGQSYFKMDDQLRGMNKLMAAGIDVGENLDWINRAAHATGRSYAEFAGIIYSAIQGNTQALVDAGLMTQRAVRIFDKYEANTIMRQQAILNFVKSHKGLMNAIKNDFETIQDQINRIKGVWQSFLQSVMGKPNDPQSFYGRVVASMRMVATAFARNMEQIKRYGYIIGQTLGWVIRQIGHFVVWLGGQAKKAIESVWTVTDDFQSKTRSLLVWLEFWKLRVVDFFKEYGGAIKTVIKLLIAYKAMKYVFVIGSKAIKSVMAYRAALLGTVALQKRYMMSMGPFIGKFAKFFQSLAVWIPRPFRKVWVSLGKFFADFRINIKSAIMGAISFIGKLGRGIRALFMSLSTTNPVGWIILAITLLVTLYSKFKGFRAFVNKAFKTWFEYLNLLWNSLAYALTWVMIGIKKIWEGIKWLWDKITGFFSWMWEGIKHLWKAFKDTSVGRFLDEYVVQPLKGVFEWIVKAWNFVVSGLGKALHFLGLANDTVSMATEEAAEKYGVWKIPTFKGGKYDDYDDTNYLEYLNPFKKGKNESSNGNPIIDTSLGSNLALPAVEDRVSSNNITFSNGAIQIIVHKGDGIDERVLAEKVRDVINDIKRDGDMRGGTI